MEYRINSGHIVMTKKFFVKESFKNNSPLQRILGLGRSNSKKVRNITQAGNLVHVKYSTLDRVLLDENFINFFDDMRQHYRNEISGYIVVYLDAEYDFDRYQIRFDFDS